MQAKGLTALVGVTILVVAGALAISLGGRSSPAPREAGEAVFPAFAGQIGEVANIKISGAGGPTTLQRRTQDAGPKTAERWLVAEKGGYPADPARVRQLLLGFAELRLVEPKTSNPEFYPRLEVEEPGAAGGHSRRVELANDAGQVFAALIVGKRSPDRLGTGADGLYLRRPGEAQSWLAQGTVDLPAETKDWLDKRVVSIAPARIRQVTLTQPDGTRLVLRREQEGGRFAIVDAPADAKVKSDTVLAEPAGVLDGLELSDVRPAAELPVPQDGVSRAEWMTFDGLTVTGESFDKDGATWVKLAASGNDKAADEAKDLADRTTPWVYGIFAYKAKPMQTKLADLVEPPKGS
jgi:hypothetical protein